MSDPRKKRSLRRRLKLALLYILKLVGGFALCRALTSRRVRILCYHGISVDDQHEFEPILFMRPETFEARMEFLRRNGWRVETLAGGVAMIANGGISGAPVIVTIDDGWKSTGERAIPTLARFGIPSTLYVTTYYAERGGDVVNVALGYVFWKSSCASATLRFGDANIDGVYDLTRDRAAVARRWLEYADTQLDAIGRQRFLRAATSALGLDPDAVLADGRFQIMDRREVRLAAAAGVDIELHTHTHRLPLTSQSEMRREIDDNRRILEEWTGGRCAHFCYPSGQHAPQHPGWLAAAGIESATTCDFGLCEAGANPFLLPRILDREEWTMLEFEAVLSGVGALFPAAAANTGYAG